MCRTLSPVIVRPLPPFRLDFTVGARLPPSSYHAIGFSRQKVRALLTVARGIDRHDIDVEELTHRPDDAVRSRLLELRGVGRWTTSSIYSGLDIRQKIIELAATVGIRNVSAQYPVILNFVRYYDSGGNLVREYLKSRQNSGRWPP